MTPINYAHLAQKYIAGADFIMEDRSYEGLRWKGPGEKPSRGFFEAAQAEEEREARAAGRQAEFQDTLMAERQEQARARVELEMRSFEEKVKAEEAQVIEEIRSQKSRAVQLKSDLALRDELLDSWREITAGQALINAEAQAYLDQTDFYVTRNQENGTPIPADITDARNRARERIVHGRLVYSRWQQLRENEWPTREEIQKGIKEGGEALERIRKVTQEVTLKYPKPGRTGY